MIPQDNDTVVLEKELQEPIFSYISPTVHTGRKREEDPIDEGGNIIVYEKDSLPFAPERIYFVNFGSTQTRGGHGHYKTEQIFIALAGLINIRLIRDEEFTEVLLDASDPYKSSIYVPYGVWHDMTPAEIGAKMCVYASTEYDSNDYFYDLPLKN